MTHIPTPTIQGGEIILTFHGQTTIRTLVINGETIIKALVINGEIIIAIRDRLIPELNKILNNGTMLQTETVPLICPKSSL